MENIRLCQIETNLYSQTYETTEIYRYIAQFVCLLLKCVVLFSCFFFYMYLDNYLSCHHLTSRAIHRVYSEPSLYQEGIWCDLASLAKCQSTQAKNFEGTKDGACGAIACCRSLGSVIHRDRHHLVSLGNASPQISETA